MKKILFMFALLISAVVGVNAQTAYQSAKVFLLSYLPKRCGSGTRTHDLKVMSLASYLCYHPTIYYKLKETCDNICRGYQFHHSIYMEIGLEPIRTHSYSKLYHQYIAVCLFIVLFQHCKDIENIFNSQIFLIFFFQETFLNQNKRLQIQSLIFIMLILL